jgi:hypothetical protein
VVKRRDGETDARYPATYTTGKGKAMTVCEPCTRSCVEVQGPQTAGYHQQPVPSSLIAGPWPTDLPHAPEPGTSTLGEGKLAYPRPHELTAAEEEQEAWVK